MRKYHARSVYNAQNIRLCKCKRNIGGSSVFSRSYRRLPINLNVMPLMTVGIVRICIKEMRDMSTLCMCANPTRPRTTSTNDDRLSIDSRSRPSNGRDVIDSDDFIFLVRLSRGFHSSRRDPEYVIALSSDYFQSD